MISHAVLRCLQRNKILIFSKVNLAAVRTRKAGEWHVVRLPEKQWGREPSQEILRGEHGHGGKWEGA